MQSYETHTTYMFLKGHNMSQVRRKVGKAGIGVGSLGQNTGYAEVSLTLSPCSVLGSSL